MPFVDARPAGLNLAFRPGTTLTVDLSWPAGFLAGRTFTSTLGVADLSVTVDGDTMTVEATQAQTGAVTAPAEWLLLEDRGGAEPEPVIRGVWSPSDDAASHPSTVTVITDEAATVEVTVSTGPSATVIEGKVDKAGDTMTGPLVVEGAVTVGAVELTGTEGSPDILVVGGAINTFHDFVLIPATHMTTTGTAPSAATAGAPRAILAKGNKVVWAREVPAGWGQISLNILFTKEATGNGNVHWSLDYQVIDFLTGESLAGTMTTIDIGAVSVPTTAQASKYYIPPGTQAILTPQQPFGIPPLIRVELTRVNDGTDTYTGSIGVAAMSVSRT